MPCALLGTHAPRAGGKSRICSKTSSAPLHVLMSAGVTSRAPVGTCPSRSSTWNSGREDFCDFCLFFLLYLLHSLILRQQPVVCNTLLVHLCRSLGMHRGMLMGQRGNEARLVVGCYQGSMGKELDQGELGLFLEVLHNLLSLPGVFVGKFSVTQELFKEI